MSWYYRHREDFIRKNKEYNQTEAGKKSAIKRANKQKLENPEKWKARQSLRNAVYRGVIVKKPCRTCRDKKVQGHHEDYSKPLIVQWFCSKHHKQIHEKS